MGTHICDTRTMFWKLYYIHPQSGRTRQAAAGYSVAAAVCPGKNLQTIIRT